MSDRCPECGSGYGHIGNCSRMETNLLGRIMVLERQLAAANERVAELAELWKIVKDEALDEYAVTLPHVAMAVSAIDRILGGGK